jgi:hypothetical protein
MIARAAFVIGDCFDIGILGIGTSFLGGELIVGGCLYLKYPLHGLVGYL